jgi:hypothetical protein
MNDQNEGIRAIAEFEAARIAAEEARKRKRKRAAAWLAPLVTFGPIFMVNLGGDHSFAHMRESYYWIAMATTLGGAIMLSSGMSRLLRLVYGQRDEIEELRSMVDVLRAATTR